MSEERIEELYEQASELEGPEKVALFEEMVRLADSMNNESWGYELRIELVEEANQAGMHDRAMVAFSWCLARHDKTDEPIDTGALLWFFKWILQEITRFSKVARDQIVAMEDDMAQRLGRGRVQPAADRVHPLPEPGADGRPAGGATALRPLAERKARRNGRLQSV